MVLNELIYLGCEVTVASACPVGANVSMYAQLHQKDYSYAVETVTISTIYSIITMSLFLLAAQYLL